MRRILSSTYYEDFFFKKPYYRVFTKSNYRVLKKPGYRVLTKTNYKILTKPGSDTTFVTTRILGA